MSMLSYVYPLTAENGKLMLTDSLNKQVEQYILSTIYTQLEERPYRPEYGLEIEEFVTVPQLTRIVNEVGQAISIGLEGFEVSFDVLASQSEDGKLNIEVHYQIEDQAQAYTVGAYITI